MTKDLLKDNIESIYPSKEELTQKLRTGKKLKIYLGIDPTGPEIHLGNAITLWKLRDFQEQGHQIILLIGDFTGMIGDPSDKSVMRKKISKEEILENTREYKNQAAKVLNFSGKNPAKIEFNSKWLSNMPLEDLLELARMLTVQQLIERDMFQKRIKNRKPISLDEFLYPLLQGFDSVAMDIDVEVGGKDQTFNMLVGRRLLKNIKNKDKFVITLPLLEGTDGRKMSKSYKNTIGITDKPNEMYGKIMSLKDELISKYFRLCTDLGSDEVKSIKEQLKNKSSNPMLLKKKLALTIVERYHGGEKANKAQEEFTRVYQKGKRTSAVVIKKLPRPDLPISYANITTLSGATGSNSEAIRLAKNKGLKIDGKLITNPREKTDWLEDKTMVDIGKRKSVKIVWE